MKTILAEELGVELSRLLSEYTEEVSEAITNEIDKTSKLMLSDVKGSTAWKDISSKYRKGFAIKKDDSKNSTSRIIYNKAKPGLVHLIELGHIKSGGGRTSSRPHLRPSFDKYAPQMEKNIEEIIKNGGK